MNIFRQVLNPVLFLKLKEKKNIQYKHDCRSSPSSEATKTVLLKIKVLHDAIEGPFCLNGSIKNL